MSQVPVVLQSITTLAIVTGTIFAVLAYVRGSKIHREAVNAQLFLNLTQRHADLIEFRKLEARNALDESFDGDLAVAAIVRDYFDLLHQEFNLASVRMLDESVWALWQGDIQRTVSTRLVREVWRERTRLYYRSSPAFCAYIEGMMPREATLSNGHTGRSACVLTGYPLSTRRAAG
jgi:predicted thioredoxin/glutaredoxin